MTINITQATHRKELPAEDDLGFGNIFTDHMLVMEYDPAKGGWGPAEIRPYGILGLEPAAACLHYSQIVWEGMKCYRRCMRSCC